MITLAAFGAFVFLGGANGTAIAFVVRDLAPFWGAFLRFMPATWIFLAIALASRRVFPQGRRLVGAALYGFFGFFATFGLIYWAIQFVEPGFGQLVMALTPLLTFLLAVMHGLEGFRWPALTGALVSLAGIAWIFHEKLVASVPAPALGAMVLASSCSAEAAVLAKRFPRADVITTNVVAMGVTAVLMLGVSLALREPRNLPGSVATWLAAAYLVVAGSAVAFGLFLFVLQRWTASAAAYQWVLLPLVALPLSAGLLGERMTGALVVGGLLVVGGVYVGAFWRPRRASVSEEPPATSSD